MSTEQQKAANRRNAEKSTGPRTPEGKARCSQNARKHGFSAANFVVVRLEEQDEVANLKADLIAIYEPVNSQELFALQRMALAQQTMLRAARLEIGLSTAALDEAMFSDEQAFVRMNPALVQDIEVTRAQNRNYFFAFGFQKMVHHANTWSLLMRYQTLAERQYRRAVEEFERLKKLRGELPTQELALEEVKPPELPNRPNPTQPEPNTPPSPKLPLQSEPNTPPSVVGRTPGSARDSQVPSAEPKINPNPIPKR